THLAGASRRQRCSGQQAAQSSLLWERVRAAVPAASALTQIVTHLFQSGCRQVGSGSPQITCWTSCPRDLLEVLEIHQRHPDDSNFVRAGGKLRTDVCFTPESGQSADVRFVPI